MFDKNLESNLLKKIQGYKISRKHSSCISKNNNIEKLPLIHYLHQSQLLISIPK